MPNILTALLLAVSFTALTGCGQTGPLYMPNETQPQHNQAGSSGTPKPTQVEPAASSGAVVQPQVEPAGDNDDAEDPLITP